MSSIAVAEPATLRVFCLSCPALEADRHSPTTSSDAPLMREARRDTPGSGLLEQERLQEELRDIIQLDRISLTV